jgi:hypothetical protein
MTGDGQGMPSLTDPWFEAEFVGQHNDHGGFIRQGAAIEGSQALFLWCPCAYGSQSGSRIHGLIVPFANPRNAPVPDGNFGIRARDGVTRPRWTMSGSSLGDLTLSPSVDVGEPSCWHGHITAGQVVP